MMKLIFHFNCSTYLKTILKETFKIIITTMKVYWFVSFSCRVRKISTISTCFSGQFVNRPKKHFSGWILVFLPGQAHPKSFWKAGRGHRERRLLIFSSFKCLDFFLLSIMCIFFIILSVFVFGPPLHTPLIWQLLQKKFFRLLPNA